MMRIRTCYDKEWGWCPSICLSVGLGRAIVMPAQQFDTEPAHILTLPSSPGRNTKHSPPRHLLNNRSLTDTQTLILFTWLDKSARLSAFSAIIAVSVKLKSYNQVINLVGRLIRFSGISRNYASELNTTQNGWFHLLLYLQILTAQHLERSFGVKNN